MARIRSVKPELFAHPKLASAPIQARYLLIGLFTQADDDGRLWDSPRALCGALFPHDKRVGEKQVDEWLKALHDTGTITRYEEKGEKCIEVTNWSVHQRVSHARPSSLPKFSGTRPELQRNGSGVSPESLQRKAGK